MGGGRAWLSATMLAATAFSLLKARDELDGGGMGQIAVGFVAAFVSGLFVVRGFLQFVSKHGFKLFAWWRIIVGTAGLIGLYVFG